jgi:pyrophosphatase PpaX
MLADSWRPTAVIFDMDGTIIDSFDYMTEIFALTLEEQLGRRLTRAEVVGTFGPGAGTEYDIIDGFAGGPSPELHRRYQEHYDAALDQLQLFPGIAEAVTLCYDAGLPVALMTGKGRPSAVATLRHFDLLEYFTAIVTGDEAIRPKPDPMGVELALAEMGAVAATTIFIGDSRADIGAGRAAGVRTILAAWHQPDDAAEVAALYHPDLVLARSEDLASWLRAALE